jgi:nucleoside-diphosphate-sugar epimerase
MRVLVTGAGGYIGIPLCRDLLAAGHQVVALDRYFFGKEKLGPLLCEPGLTVAVQDIRTFDLDLLNGVEAVVDLAGLSNDMTADLDPELTRQINELGAARVMREARARGVRRYVYSSSASVYGHGVKTHLAEDDECRPQTMYAQSKLSAERMLMALATQGFEPVVFRYATIFGVAPRMRFDLAVNIMTLRAIQERVIYIMGGGEQWRPFVHVRDVVRALLIGLNEDAALVSGQTFNVGHESMNHQIKDIARFVLDAVPNTTVHNIPDNPDLRTYNLSFEKIRRVLGYVPERTIPDGVAEIKQAVERGLIRHDDPTSYTLQWYKSLLEWQTRISELSLEGRLL